MPEVLRGRPPNMRLQLAGGDRSKGSGVLAPWRARTVAAGALDDDSKLLPRTFRRDSRSVGALLPLRGPGATGDACDPSPETSGLLWTPYVWVAWPGLARVLRAQRHLGNPCITHPRRYDPDGSGLRS